MVIQRSRKWVKDRLPAFICRETSWWVTRWIQCNVFLCPECRKEYRSLKSVWEKLDNWQVEEPEEEFQACFIENFRQKYPGAYQEKESPSVASGFWLSRVAYTCALALVAFAVYWQAPNSGDSRRTLVNNPPPAESSTKVAQVTVPPVSPAPVTESRVSEAPAPIPEPAKEERVAVAAPLLERRPLIQNLPASGTHYRFTSTLDPAPYEQELDSNLRRRTVEINDMPVSGFESLSRPYQEERPY